MYWYFCLYYSYAKVFWIQYMLEIKNRNKFVEIQDLNTEIRAPF